MNFTHVTYKELVRGRDALRVELAGCKANIASEFFSYEEKVGAANRAIVLQDTIAVYDSELMLRDEHLAGLLSKIRD